MNYQDILRILKNKLLFSDSSIEKLKKFHDMLILANKRYNLISKNSEKDIWLRHILDSAQIVQYINNDVKNISDFGSGAGFPGAIIAVFDVKKRFHMKLYEKSPVKRSFLNEIKSELDVDFEVCGNIYENNLSTDLVVCRAFKKLEEIINISRETLRKPHKLIILKGKNAQLEINKVPLSKNYSYKLKDSITDSDSKLIIIEAR